MVSTGSELSGALEEKFYIFLGLAIYGKILLPLKYKKLH